MAISHELIVNPADIRISIECKTCKARLEYSRSAYHREKEPNIGKTRDFPPRCPSCDDDWTEVHKVIIAFLSELRRVELLKVVTFRISDANSQKEASQEAPGRAISPEPL